MPSIVVRPIARMFMVRLSPFSMMYDSGRVGGRCSLVSPFCAPHYEGGRKLVSGTAAGGGSGEGEEGPRRGEAGGGRRGRAAEGGYIAKARSGLTGPLRAFIVLASSAPLMWYRAVTRPERPSLGVRT